DPPVAVLYATPDSMMLLCRHCCGLVYRTQRQDTLARARHQGKTLRLRLGDYGDCLSALPEKPKGMHWRTYLRHYEELAAVERYALSEMTARIQKIGGWAGI